jgi:hypothetical protein
MQLEWTVVIGKYEKNIHLGTLYFYWTSYTGILDYSVKRYGTKWIQYEQFVWKLGIIRGKQIRSSVWSRNDRCGDECLKWQTLRM